MGKQWKQCQTLFLGVSKITTDGDCSHEIKRHLFLGRKVMTNLDSIFTPLRYSCLENHMDGRRRLIGCSPWGHWELDTTQWLHFHFSLSCIGKGNGNPLQCSCLENPRDGRTWWAALYGVAQSRTRLKWLSRSSSSIIYEHRYKGIFKKMWINQIKKWQKIKKNTLIHVLEFSDLI